MRLPPLLPVRSPFNRLARACPALLTGLGLVWSLGAGAQVPGAAAADWNMPVLSPPELAGLMSARNLALAGTGQRRLDQQLEFAARALSSSKNAGQPAHSRIARLGHVADEATAFRQAKTEGADTLLLVRDRGTGQDSKSVTRQVSECTSRKSNAGAIERALGLDCAQFGMVSRYCTVNSVAWKVSLDLYNVASGQLLSSLPIESAAQHENCPNNAANKTPEQIQSGVEFGFQVRLQGALVASASTVAVSFILPDEELRKSGKDGAYREAVLFLQNGRADRACPTLSGLAAQVPRSVSVQWAAGVCAESQGQTQAALAHVQAADAATGQPNAGIAAALARLRARAGSGLEAGSAPASFAAQTPAYTPPAEVALASSVAPKAGSVPRGPRVALVVGNSRYQHVSQLANPVNDAADMRDALRRVGFSVVHVENASRDQMLRAINQFSEQLRKDGTALVFYAGHGMQVKGENYLMPIDANPKTDNEVETEAVNLNRILSRMERSGVNVVMLDACRNDPFKRSWRSAGGSGGLASVDAPTGTLISYATAPGRVADDGGGRNSPYTKAVLRAMQQPDAKIEDVFKAVRREVAAATRNQQTPWESSSLVGDFYFTRAAGN